jgi:hypothetical protein
MPISPIQERKSLVRKFSPWPEFKSSTSTTQPQRWDVSTIHLRYVQKKIWTYSSSLISRFSCYLDTDLSFIDSFPSSLKANRSGWKISPLKGPCWFFILDFKTFLTNFIQTPYITWTRQKVRWIKSLCECQNLRSKCSTYENEF